MYRYIGNKTRLAHWLVDRIRDVSFSGATVADPMCGTAAVSEALRCSGFKVIASDLMTYAVHHARVRLLLREAPRFDGLGYNYLQILSRLNELPPMQGYFHKEYSPEGLPEAGCEPRKYLTSENAAKLDAMNAQIRAWLSEGRLTDLEHSLLRHDLIMAVNRVANIAGTYGHFRSTWSKAAISPIGLTPSKFISNFRIDHEVMQGPAEDLAGKMAADVCYLDPPYMKRQYAANYHLIETVARGDEPPAIGVSGLRPWRDQYSVFCTKTRIQSAFASIVESMDCPVFLISYSEDGLLKEDDLCELLTAFGHVEIEKREFPRFRSNRSALGETLNEFLVTLTRMQHSVLARRA